MSSHEEVVRSIEPWVGEQLGSLLRPVSESWQPADFLPDMSRPGWEEELAEFRKRSEALPDDLLVVLVGDMVTEEALPTYQTGLNRLEGIRDPTGSSDSPWARWTRGWTAEENRHGDLLNRYLYLTGRVDMRAVETTVHHLLAEGFDPKFGSDPYLGFVYTSFQERATRISHRNVATMALRAGDESLHRICGQIAGDEARHEKAYTLFMTRIFEIDPIGAVSAFATMMKRKITMPAARMRDAADDHLFIRYARVAQKTGVYTARDYAEIIDSLVRHWNIGKLTGLSGLAASAQDYLCGLAERYLALSERIAMGGSDRFSWIFGREAG